MNLFVVIPAFNEAAVIARTIAEVKNYCPNVIVVDDGSIDETAKVAETAGAAVLRHIINRGQGAALRTGINCSLAEGAEAIVTFDADGQFDAGEINKISAPVISGECDVVLGSRFLPSSSVIPESPQAISGIPSSNSVPLCHSRESGNLNLRNRIPFFKNLLLKSAVLFTRAITGLRLTDTHNGFRAMSRRAAEKIIIRQDRMAHASDIIHEIARLNLKYKEMPVTVKYTDYSRGKGQKLSGAWRILFDIILK